MNPLPDQFLIDGSIQELDCVQLVGKKFFENRVEIELSQGICMLCAVYFVPLYLNSSLVVKTEWSISNPSNSHVNIYINKYIYIFSLAGLIFPRHSKMVRSCEPASKSIPDR